MKIDMQDIFEQAGNLFYAVAKEQGLQAIQLAELKLLINENWLPRYNEGKDNFPTPAAHTILITLDSLEAADATAKEAYGKFAQFYILHTEAFTHELQVHISETVQEIIRIFPSAPGKHNQYGEAIQDLFRPPISARISH
jgi:hypothetical protein